MRLLKSVRRCGKENKLRKGQHLLLAVYVYYEEIQNDHCPDPFPFSPMVISFRLNSSFGRIPFKKEFIIVLERMSSHILRSNFLDKLHPFFYIFFIPK